MQAWLPPCARFPLTARVPCPNLREEGGLPVVKTTADLYKLAHVGGTVSCTAGECSCLSRRSRHHSVFFHGPHITMQTRSWVSSSRTRHLICLRARRVWNCTEKSLILIFGSQNRNRARFPLQCYPVYRAKYVLLCLKAQFLFKNWHCLWLATALWNCSINPRWLFPGGKVKIFSNSFVLLIQQRIPCFTRAAQSRQGQRLFHAAMNQFIQVDRCSAKLAARQTENVRVHTQRGIGRDKQTQAHAYTLQNIFPHRIKVRCLALCRGLLTFNRFQDPSIVWEAGKDEAVWLYSAFHRPADNGLLKAARLMPALTPEDSIMSKSGLRAPQ